MILIIFRPSIEVTYFDERINVVKTISLECVINQAKSTINKSVDGFNSGRETKSSLEITRLTGKEYVSVHRLLEPFTP
jgi:hypothetical protein